MAIDIPGIRPPVISRETEKRLGEYLRFRHLIRNLYIFDLEYEKIRPLIKGISTTITGLKRDMRRFLRFMEGLGSNI